MTSPPVAAGRRSAEEDVLRERLGIPVAADRVLLLVESTHWDPGWLLTSEEYYRVNVRWVLDRVIEELEADPRRVYNLECVYYLRKYWERTPTRRDQIRHLINEGRLRFGGPGITTPDTLLPTEEALLRDLLLGYRWLQDQGCTVQPRVMYLPDSFGHSPGVPSLARAAGISRVSLTRIDGMFFSGAEREPPSSFPRPGSSAELLLRSKRSIDFVWRDANGSEVLAHWNAFGYGHGDMIAAKGISRWMGVPFIYRAARSEPEVRAKIESYVADLEPVSPTPYLLCALGSDFVPPVPDLGGIIDLWNESQFERTGIWVMSGSLDSYFDLLEIHRDRLPVVEFDPNPYWTGFYSARLDLKQGCRRLADTLVAAELIAGSRDPDTCQRTTTALAEPWATAAFSNHHDMITGTSPDRVVRKEQQPLLARAQVRADRVLGDVVSGTDPPAVDEEGGAVEWDRDGDEVSILTSDLDIRLDGAQGGCIVEVRDRATGKQLLAGPGFELIAWEDRGGLWRMGQEFPGGRFRAIERISDRSAQIDIATQDGDLEITARTDLDGRPTFRRYSFRGNSIRVTTTVGANDRRTVTMRVPSAVEIHTLLMEQPGSGVSRPTQRHYRPTFWPVSSRVRGQPAGLILEVELPTGVAVTEDGTIELVVARNANREMSWRVVPFRGMPAKGRVRGDVTMTTAWSFAGSNDPAGPSAMVPRAVAPATYGLVVEACRSFSIDRGDVALQAVKGAEDGNGIIVRLRALGATGGSIAVRPPWQAKKAIRCDALERDLYQLALENGVAVLELAEPITSVRFVP